MGPMLTQQIMTGARQPAGVLLESPPYRIIDQVSADLKLTRDELARALGIGSRTLERWRIDERYPQRQTRRRLRELLDLDHHLRDTFTSDAAIVEWVHGPSRYLGGLTPADAIRVGRFDRVEAALEAMDSGVFV
jgi:uncharacterized protein (DUF2384 family)